jgi:hypothetical protein
MRNFEARLARIEQRVMPNSGQGLNVKLLCHCETEAQKRQRIADDPRSVAYHDDGSGTVYFTTADVPAMRERIAAQQERARQEPHTYKLVLLVGNELDPKPLPQ